MAFKRLTTKKATSLTPQVVTLVVDDSGSMGGSKAADATKGVQEIIITIQAGNQGASNSRFFVNIAKFGSTTIPLVEAGRPESVSLTQLTFTGDSGGTEMAGALNWAVHSTQKALGECRKISKYIEESSPNPLVLFFSDGANTGGDVGPAAQALRAIPFGGGNVDVVAVGIGMNPGDFSLMERIASQPELAVNIDPSQLAEFLAEVGATLQKGEEPGKLIKQFD
jgi:uncharacterized protein YegL